MKNCFSLCSWLFLCLSLMLSQSSYAQLQVFTELSPPNQTLQNNQVAGTSTALVRQILQRANLTGEFIMYPWARAYNSTLKQPNGLIYSMAKTPEREDLFHWIGAVAVFHLGFVSNRYRSDIQIKSLADAKQYKIAVQRGDVAAGTLKALGFNFIETSDIQKSYELLVANRVDLVIDDPRYVTSMAEALNLPDDHFAFIYDIEQLTVKGYLAANKQLPEAVIVELRKAFEQVATSAEYKKVLEL